MQTRTLATLTLLAAVIALSGCKSETETAPPSPTPAAEVAPAPNDCQTPETYDDACAAKHRANVERASGNWSSRASSGNAKKDESEK